MADTAVTFRLFGVDVSASRAIDNVGKHANKAAADIDRLNRSGGGASKSLGGMTSAMGAFGGAGGAAGMVVSALAKGVLALASAAGVAAGAIGRAGIAAASFNEQMAVSLGTLTGSADKAQKHLADLQKFALNTPFEMAGLAEMDRGLLGVGMRVQDVIPYLQLWGDYTSALGLSQEQMTRIVQANTQALGAGRYTLEDLNQIANNGASNIYPLLSQALGKTVPEIRKMATEGKLTVDQFDKVYAVMQKNYFGNMQKQSQTLSGLWSNVTDAFSQGAAKALTDSGVIDAIKAALTDLIPLLTSFFGWLGDTGIPALMAIGQAIEQSVGPGLDRLAGGLEDNAGLFVETVNSVIALINALGPLMAFFGGNQVLMFAAALHGVNVAIEGVGIALSTLVEALARVMDQAAKLPGPFQDTAKSIAGSMHAAALSMASDFAAISNPRITVHVAVVRDNSTNAVYGGGGHYEGGTFVPDPGRAAPSTTYTNGIPNLAPDLSSLLNGLGGSFGGGGGGGGGKGGASKRKQAAQEVGRDLGRAFIRGITGTKDQARAAWADLLTDVLATHNKAAIRLVRATKLLYDRARATYDRIMQKFEWAKATVENFMSSGDVTKLFDAGTKDTTTGGGTTSSTKMTDFTDAKGLRTITSQTTTGTTPATKTAGQKTSILSNLRSLVAKTKRMDAVLKRLYKLGIAPAVLAQLVAAGIDGLPAAEELLGMGASGIRQINSLQRQLQKYAESIGIGGANAQYDAGRQMQRGLLRGMQAQEKALVDYMTRLGDRMARALRKKLGIRSPSAVFHEIGGYVGQGLINGVDSRAVEATRAAQGLVGRVQAAAAAGGSTPGGQTIHVHVHNAVVGNEQQIVRVVKTALGSAARGGVGYARG